MKAHSLFSKKDNDFFIFQQIKLCLNKGLQKYNK